MAVVEYKCSVCKRTINLVQFKQGLDWIGNCNITLGCRGQLIQQEVFPDYVRGNLPTDVIGLKNWVQRQVLFNFTQTVDRQNWIITHNLGVQPSVQVFVNVPISGDLQHMEEILPTEIIYNTDDQLTLILPKPYTGTAQLIARASNPDILNPRPRPIPVVVPPTIQLTNAGLVTIATRASTSGTDNNMAVTLAYTDSSGNVIDIGYIATNVPANTSPWSDVTRVMFKGKVYLVRTFSIQGSTQITNGSSVSMVSINPTGQITLNIASLDLPNNAFQVTGDYSAYFVPDSLLTIEGTLTINDRIWTVLSSDYSPVTNLTSIVPTDVIPLSFPLPAQIVQSGARQIFKDEVIALLGTTPFTIYDKIMNSYVDFDFLTDLPGALAFNLYFDNGDIFANTSIEESVYPPIRSV